MIGKISGIGNDGCWQNPSGSIANFMGTTHYVPPTKPLAKRTKTNQPTYKPPRESREHIPSLLMGLGLGSILTGLVVGIWMLAGPNKSSDVKTTNLNKPNQPPPPALVNVPPAPPQKKLDPVIAKRIQDSIVTSVTAMSKKSGYTDFIVYYPTHEYFEIVQDARNLITNGTKISMWSEPYEQDSERAKAMLRAIGSSSPLPDDIEGTLYDYAGSGIIVEAKLNNERIANRNCLQDGLLASVLNAGRLNKKELNVVANGREQVEDLQVVVRGLKIAKDRFEIKIVSPEQGEKTEGSVTYREIIKLGQSEGIKKQLEMFRLQQEQLKELKRMNDLMRDLGRGS